MPGEREEEQYDGVAEDEDEAGVKEERPGESQNGGCGGRNAGG